MKKTDIRTVAAWSEILASIAVIVSLAFVVISLNQNTAALQSLNDNFLYELQDSRMAAVESDVPLANIFVKVDAGETLSAEEETHYRYWNLRELNMWEIAFTRHQEGLMPPAQWEAWEMSFITGLIPWFPKEEWDSVAYGYGSEFQAYVEEVYANLP